MSCETRHERVVCLDTDQDIDPWSHDVAGWAVEAQAGATWEDDCDSLKRLAFWDWWLTEAINEAWSESSQPTQIIR